MPDFSYARPPAQENMFLDLVQRLARHCAGRRAVYIRLSGLMRPYDGANYKRIAAETFAAQVGGMEGHLFKFESGDLAFIAGASAAEMLTVAARRVGGLFGFSLQGATQAHESEAAILFLYDLEKEYEDLLTRAQKIVREAEEKRTRMQASPFFISSTVPLGPERLAALDAALGNVDVTNVTRRQTICTIIEDTTPQPLFEEVFVSIGELEKTLAPGVQLDADPWLFRYLTTALDQRVMRMLIRDGLMTRRPFSLNLNIATVLSPAFARFENVIAPQVKGRIVIEMNKLDVFSDMNAFFFVRDYLHERGFRLCLDGVTHLSLPHCNRLKLGFDLIKLFWAPNALDVMPEKQWGDIRSLVQDAGQAHTILCRCDDARAVQVGRGLGVVMFQGRYVDSLLGA